MTLEFFNSPLCLPGRDCSFVAAARRIIANMAASTKPTSPSRRKPSATPAGVPSEPSGPFLRFYHTEGLRKKTLSLLRTLEQAEDPCAHRDDLADIVVELTISGMDYYFMRPLKLAKAGFIVQQSANLGLAGVQQVMGSVIRNIIGRMEGPQLLSVCGSIRQLML